MNVNVTVERPDARSIDIRRRYPGSASLLWRMFTDPGHFARWWGPEGTTCTKCEIDLRPGGAWETVITGEQMGDMPVGGVYREIDAPYRVTFTWAWLNDEKPHESLVAIELTEFGDECEVRILHRELSEAQTDSHLGGWTSALDCLAQTLAGG